MSPLLKPSVQKRLSGCGMLQLSHRPSREEIEEVVERAIEEFANDNAGTRLEAARLMRQHLLHTLEVAMAPGCDLVEPLLPDDRAATPLPIYTAREVQDMPDPEWQVEDLFQETSLVTLFGKEGTYKTFTALDLALCVATGIAFHGREVREGAVVYLYAEGAPGLKLRLRAWAKVHRYDPRDLPNIWFIPTAVNLMEEGGGGLEALINTIQARAGDSLGLIIIDTLARCFGEADENETQAMNTFTNRCGKLSQTFGSSVLVLHHPGWHDTKRERGSRSLRNNFDTSIRCSKAGRSRVKLECKKQKDAPPFDPLELRVDEIQLPGEETSLVLRSTDSMDTMGLELQEGAVHALEKLASLDVEGATFTDWMGETSLTESTFKRRRSALVEGGYVIGPPDDETSRGFLYQPTTKGFALLDSRRDQNGVSPTSAQTARLNGSGPAKGSPKTVGSTGDSQGSNSGSEGSMNPSADSGPEGGAYKAPPGPEAPRYGPERERCSQ